MLTRERCATLAGLGQCSSQPPISRNPHGGRGTEANIDVFDISLKSFFGVFFLSISLVPSYGKLRTVFPQRYVCSGQRRGCFSARPDRHMGAVSLEDFTDRNGTAPDKAIHSLQTKNAL